MPQAYWIIPLEGGGGQIDNSLPGGRPGHVGSRPIYHPGRSGLTGLPVSGQSTARFAGRPIDPGHPGHGLPSSPVIPATVRLAVPGRHRQWLPEGEPVPPDTINPPLPAYLPEPYDDKVIVAIKRPDVVEWTRDGV